MYDVYGWFKFEGEPAGVMALGRQWVMLQQVAALDNWQTWEQMFDNCVQAKRAAFAPAQPPADV